MLKIRGFVFALVGLVACGLGSHVSITPEPNAPHFPPSDTITVACVAPQTGAMRLARLHLDAAYQTSQACEERLASEAKSLGANYVWIENGSADVVARCTASAYRLTDAATATR